MIEKTLKIIGAVVVASILVTVPILTGFSWYFELAVINLFGTILTVGEIAIIAVLLYAKSESE